MSINTALVGRSLSRDPMPGDSRSHAEVRARSQRDMVVSGGVNVYRAETEAAFWADERRRI